ncbi:MAG: hypothetical protein ACI9US_004458 [Gammaproteobacteria bacterium]
MIQLFSEGVLSLRRAEFEVLLVSSTCTIVGTKSSRCISRNLARCIYKKKGWVYNGKSGCALHDMELML